MFEKINQLMFGLFLLIAAWQDGKEKKINIALFLTAGVAGGILSLLHGQWGIDRLLSSLTGVGLLMFGRLSREAIGYGDGLFFIVSGLFLPLNENLQMLIFGLMICGLASGGIIFIGFIKGRNMRGKTLPFIPFLIPAWIGMAVL